MGEDTVRGSKKAGVDPVGLIAAYALTAVVGFAAYAKLSAPDPHKLVFGDVPLDYLVAGFELVLILLLLPFHRSKLLWGAVTVMFGGFAGYAGYWTFSKGAPCGCFGDLWHPPLGVTVGLDVGFVVIGSLCAWRFGMGRRLRRLSLVGALIAGGAGALYAYKYSPEAYDPNEDRTVPEEGDSDVVIPEFRDVQDRLWFSELLAEQRALQESGEIIATLVFVYEVGCSTCEIYKPDLEAYRELFEGEQDFTMRIVMVSTEEAFEHAGIEIWAWEPAPISFVARGGVVDSEQFRFSGEDTPLDLVEQVYEWANDGVPMPYESSY